MEFFVGTIFIMLYTYEITDMLFLCLKTTYRLRNHVKYQLAENVRET